jgi:iron-sulfur cluster assembly protein/iron-sulfur cluster insertion protein
VEESPTTATTQPQVIGLSEAANQKVGELLTMEGNPELALRIAVRPGGCSGYSYEMFFDSEIAPDDIRSSCGQVRVVVDPASAQLLTGATLEYKDGLQGAGFSIDNPNAQRSCGCGQSFS